MALPDMVMSLRAAVLGLEVGQLAGGVAADEPSWAGWRSM
jgi:hypothetical protein